MRVIRAGLAHLDSTVGAFDSNTRRIIAAAQELSDRGSTMICFAEQAISGYPCEDLVLWDGFVRAQWKKFEEIAAATRSLPSHPVIVLGLAIKQEQHIYNCAAVLCDGNIVGIVPKEQLPTYDVFYEGRTFSHGVPGRVGELNGVPFGDLIFEAPFGTFAVEVCEDVWVPDGPMRRRALSGAELVVNCSASPWRMGVVELRKEKIAERAADNLATVIYVNMVGGNDSLVFDGGGWVNQNGAFLIETPRWTEELAIVDIDLEVTARARVESVAWQTTRKSFLLEKEAVHRVHVPGGPAALSRGSVPGGMPVSSSRGLNAFEELLAATKLGLAGYFEKTGAFDRIGVALSGGKDSVLSLIIAWLYAQEKFANLSASEQARRVRDFVHGISMPTRFNSDVTKNIARLMAEELGVTFVELSIEDAFAREIAATQALNGGTELSGLTIQNIQSRIRGMRMWNWSNAVRGLWLQTGNMSEKATGYTTVGGDLMGGYSLLGNMPKTLVTALLEYLHEMHGWKALELLLATKASAELAPDQEDERDLMPFPVLDACFELFAGEKLMPEEVYTKLRARFTDDELKRMRADYQPELLREWVDRFTKLFVHSIYKWVQAPQAVHLAPLDLDRERALQLPVVQSMEWLKPRQILE